MLGRGCFWLFGVRQRGLVVKLACILLLYYHVIAKAFPNGLKCRTHLCGRCGRGMGSIFEECMLVMACQWADRGLVRIDGLQK